MDHISLLVCTYYSCNATFVWEILRLLSSQLTTISLRTWSQGSFFLLPYTQKPSKPTLKIITSTNKHIKPTKFSPISYLLLNGITWLIIISDPWFQPWNHYFLSSFLHFLPLHSLAPLLPPTIDKSSQLLLSYSSIHFHIFLYQVYLRISPQQEIRFIIYILPHMSFSSRNLSVCILRKIISISNLSQHSRNTVDWMTGVFDLKQNQTASLY